MQCTGHPGCFPRGKRAAIVRRYPVVVVFFLCAVFSCFRNPPNSDMDYRVFIMRTLLCVRIHTGFVGSLVRWFVRSFVRFFHSSIHSFIRVFLCSSVHRYRSSVIDSLIDCLIDWFIHSFIHSFINFIRSCIPLLLCSSSLVSIIRCARQRTVAMHYSYLWSSE